MQIRDAILQLREEQIELKEYLDGLPEAEKRVTSLRSRQECLGIKLLDYIKPGTSRSVPDDWHYDLLTTIQIQLVVEDFEVVVNALQESETISPRIVQFPDSYPYRLACAIKDPDGHNITLITHKRTMSKPTVKYWHVWTDNDGVSHQTQCELTNFEQESMGGDADPQWNDHLLKNSDEVLFSVLPVGWKGEWHENPKPQWVVPLSGKWFVETMDGTRIEMGAGEFSFGGDQETKPNDKGNKGHLSGTVGDKPAVLMIVQLDDKWSKAQPGDFN